MIKRAIRAGRFLFALPLAWLIATGGPVPAASASEPRAAKPTKASAMRAGQPQFSSSESIQRWINGYRAKPEPKRLPEAVKAMTALGLLKDQEANGLYVGFIAGVLGDNQLEADALVAGMFPMPPEDQVSLIKAIAYSGLPDWKDVLTRVVERMPARKVLIDRYLRDKTKVLKDLGLDSGPPVLDANWGYYFATGSFEPVQRIIGALQWSKEENSVEKLTVAGMAKYTLAFNAARDSDLVALYRSEAGHGQPAVRTALREVIEATETMELGKLRREALASIEDLKRKGPARDRNATWWAGAGTTVLALGCVAAAAAGQAQFGIPCVVGGPVAQAAAKYALPYFMTDEK